MSSLSLPLFIYASFSLCLICGGYVDGAILSLERKEIHAQIKQGTEELEDVEQEFECLIDKYRKDMDKSILGM